MNIILETCQIAIIKRISSRKAGIEAKKIIIHYTRINNQFPCIIFHHAVAKDKNVCVHLW
jgi:hypothetical protein